LELPLTPVIGADLEIGVPRGHDRQSAGMTARVQEACDLRGSDLVIRLSRRHSGNASRAVLCRISRLGILENQHGIVRQFASPVCFQYLAFGPQLASPRLAEYRLEVSMFGVNWSDSQTLWLNIINLSLGLVTLVCIAAIGYGVFQDVRERSRKRASARSMDREVGVLGSRFGDHAFNMPGLGLTMADGGEPLKEPAQSPKTPRKASAKTPRKSGR
jgi:hypothetical protein